MEPKVGVIMGSKSDWETMKHACDILDELNVPFEKKVVSAHRTPDYMFEYAEQAHVRGIEVIIAGAGGAAHLPGMVASKTLLPVIGVPVQSKALNGMDSLLSIVQMPNGVPVATVSIGKAGATNAGLLAAQFLAVHDSELRERLQGRREKCAMRHWKAAVNWNEDNLTRTDNRNNRRRAVRQNDGTRSEGSGFSYSCA